MKIRKYFFASLLLIIVTGAIVHFKHEIDFTTDFFGSYITLPISVWFSIPMLILFIASFTHISYYTFKRYLNDRAIAKDHKNLIEAIKKSLLSEKSNYEFKNDEYKNLAKLIQNSKIYLDDKNVRTGIEDIDTLIEQQLSLQDGKVVNLKSLRLSEGNEYKIQNIKNKIAEDIKNAKDILRNNTSYSEDILKLAFAKIVEQKSENDIKNGMKSITIDKSLAFSMFDLYNEELHLSYEELKEIVTEAKLGSLDFIEMACKLKPKMIPDDLISLFDKLSGDIDSAKDAYVYVLLDLEMLEQVKEMFENSDSEEYQAYRAYLSLKEAGINYSLDKFLRGIY
jgi:hypothetical protein